MCAYLIIRVEKRVEKNEGKYRDEAGMKIERVTLK